MTSLAATTAIFILFHSTRFASIVPAFRPEIIRMTGGAKTYVLRGVIINSFAVTVTGNTGYRRAVITRIVAGSVGKIDRCPSVCGMADITFLGGNKMSR